MIPGSTPASEKQAMVKALVDDVKAQICSGKAGAAALQYFRDGTFLCPTDSIQDNLKMLDTAITNLEYTEKASIGMCVNANELWDEEQEGYFLHNPKKPTDEETLVSFLDLWEPSSN